jgi:hypothetical protein
MNGKGAFTSLSNRGVWAEAQSGLQLGLLSRSPFTSTPEPTGESLRARSPPAVAAPYWSAGFGVLRDSDPNQKASQPRRLFADHLPDEFSTDVRVIMRELLADFPYSVPIER